VVNVAKALLIILGYNEEDASWDNFKKEVSNFSVLRTIAEVDPNSITKK
jgi:hypothetical protein